MAMYTTDTILRWIKHRDEETTELKHYLESEDGRRFAVIDKPERRYRVRVLDHSPFHTMSLAVAKSSGMFVMKELNKNRRA